MSAKAEIRPEMKPEMEDKIYYSKIPHENVIVVCENCKYEGPIKNALHDITTGPQSGIAWPRVNVDNYCPECGSYIVSFTSYSVSGRILDNKSSKSYVSLLFSNEFPRPSIYEDLF